MIRFRTLAAVIACCSAMTMMLGAGVGDAASSPAVTGHATGVTSTSAQLNGVINPGGLPTVWAFQYGTSATAYGRSTAPVGPLTGTAPLSVSTLIKGLRPSTIYHFRLIAAQGGYPQTGYTGDDMSFKTLASGSTAPKRATRHAKASLRSRTLAVRHGHAVMPWGCSGTRGAVCKGKISLSARGTFGGKLTTVSCGGATYSAPTGTHRNVRLALGKKCLALIATSSHHRLGASLKAVFSLGAGNLKARVTLVAL